MLPSPPSTGDPTTAAASAAAHDGGLDLNPPSPSSQSPFRHPHTPHRPSPMRGGGGGRGGHRDKGKGQGHGHNRDEHRRQGWRHADHRPRRRSPSPARARRQRDGDDRDLPRRGHRGYGMPYRHQQQRRREGGAGGRYEVPPDYMLPDHPSDLGQPSARAFNKDAEFLANGGRGVAKESEYLGDAGLSRAGTLGLGRQSTLFLDHSSPLPPPPVVLPPPRTLYPSVPPDETGYLTGLSAMKAGENLGGRSTRVPHDDSVFQYREHLHDPYGERNRERERLYSSRDMLGTELPSHTQLRVFSGPSSSALAKDRSHAVHGDHSHEPSNGYATDGLGRLSHDSLGHVGGNAHRFSDNSLGHGNGHNEMIVQDTTRQIHSKYPPRPASMEYDAHGFSRKDAEGDTYLASDDVYGNALRGSRDNIRDIIGSTSLIGLQDERMDHQVRLSHRMPWKESGFRGMHYDIEHDVHPSFHEDASTPYHKTRDVHEDYPHSTGPIHPGIAGRLACRDEIVSFNDGYELHAQDVSPMVYRERSRTPPAYHDHEMDMYQADVNSLGRGYYEDDMDASGLTLERIPRRDYDMVDDADGYDARYATSTGRNVFSRIALPDDAHEEWADGDQEDHVHPNRSYGRSKYKTISHRLSKPIAQSQFGESSMHGRGGWTKSAKKRLRPALPQYHGGHASERNEFVRPNKFLKWSEDKRNSLEANHEDAPEEDHLSMMKDPAEGSEEFKMQVHRAFLKFSKMLNESPTKQKRYREATKGSLACCVCGSSSRKFPDIDALISHTYDTCKVGLKTKHLGFHKALCVLMGWNWRVAPDTSKAYHSIPTEEVNAMKEDLILWPPLVVIRNSSIGNKATATEAKIVSIEEIEGILIDIGIAGGKSKVSHGRPANQSVFLVKFQPTFSGLQEAKKIHEHFAEKNHGKQEFQQLKGGKAKKVALVDKVEELLYAYIAVAEDLVYLDEETKKRWLVKSKKDIEAIADAPLKFDS